MPEPLASDSRDLRVGTPSLSDPREWDRCLEAIGPAAMLVAIGERMNGDLRARLAPEDIWQEALLRAWRSRETFEWRGLASFRRWLLEIAERCIWDAVDRARTQKRGDGAIALALERGASANGSELEPAFSLIASTTPSRVAMYREQSQAMHEALDSLPTDLREVVSLRLFEGLSCGEVAVRLNLGVSAVKHRFRKAGLMYRQRLEHILSSRGAPDRCDSGPA